MKRSKIAILTALALLAHAAAANATIACKGQIGYLGYDQNGAVVIAAGTNIHTICSSTAQGNFQIGLQACKGFYATLLAHRLAGKPVTIYYNDPALTACSQIGSWTNQSSAYFIEMSE